MKIQLEWQYALLAVAYLAAIYRLSSLPDLGVTEAEPLVLLVSNLSHVPLFAGLAFCVLKSLAGARAVRWGLYGLAFAASGACAVLDEWHQSFVPGRHGSTGDFALDLAGIGGMLLILRFQARWKEQRRAAAVGRLAALVMSTLPSLTPLPTTVPMALGSRLPAGSNPKVSGTGTS